MTCVRYAAVKHYLPEMLTSMRLLMPPVKGNELAWDGLRLLGRMLFSGVERGEGGWNETGGKLE